MTKQMKTHQLKAHHRVVGIIVGVWLTLFLSSLLLVGLTFITVPLAAAFGPTRVAQKLARPGLALAGGTVAFSLMASTIVAGPLTMILSAAVAAALWLKLGDLDVDHRLRPAVA